MRNSVKVLSFVSPIDHITTNGIIAKKSQIARHKPAGQPTRLRNAIDAVYATVNPTACKSEHAKMPASQLPVSCSLIQPNDP